MEETAASEHWLDEEQDAPVDSERYPSENRKRGLTSPEDHSEAAIARKEADGVLRLLVELLRRRVPPGNGEKGDQRGGYERELC